jgi:hypothetical protein
MQLLTLQLAQGSNRAANFVVHHTMHDPAFMLQAEQEKYSQTAPQQLWQ